MCLKRSWSHLLTSPEIIVSICHPARFARAVELRAPGDFFSSLLMVCYCVLHALRHFVHWNWCIKAMCSTVVCCKSIACVVQFNLRRSQWNGCAKASRRVLVLRCCVLRFRLCFAGHCWQIALGLLHHGCDLNVIGMCTKHCFFRVNGGSVAEKSWLVPWRS